MLKDKLGHIQHFKSLIDQKLIESGSAKPEVVRSTLPTGARGKT